MGQDSPAAQEAKQQAYRFLRARGRTTREVRDHLRQRGLEAAVIESVLRELEAEGYLDDRKLALDWTRYRLQTHPCGRRRLAWELEGRGVERALREEVLREVYAEVDEAALAERALAKRLRPEAHELSPRDYGRLVRYLMRLGFDADVIRGILAARVPSPAPSDIGDSDPAC
jgi:regulatory protein